MLLLVKQQLPATKFTTFLVDDFYSTFSVLALSFVGNGHKALTR